MKIPIVNHTLLVSSAASMITQTRVPGWRRSHLGPGRNAARHSEVALTLRCCDAALQRVGLSGLIVVCMHPSVSCTPSWIYREDCLRLYEEGNKFRQPTDPCGHKKNSLFLHPGHLFPSPFLSLCFYWPAVKAIGGGPSKEERWAFGSEIVSTHICSFTITDTPVPLQLSEHDWQKQVELTLLLISGKNILSCSLGNLHSKDVKNRPKHAAQKQGKHFSSRSSAKTWLPYSPSY